MIANIAPTRKSTRIHNDKPLIATREIGNSNRLVTDAELRRFVSVEITDQHPQIVSLPIPPERHAILVDVQQNNGRIMVSDWGGSQNKTRGFQYLDTTKRTKNKAYNPDWEQYSVFMKLLEEKYNLPVQYCDVDPKLYDDADRHHKRFKSGGCSYYIYEWTQKYYTKYYI